MDDDAYAEMMAAPIAEGPYYPEAMGAFLNKLLNPEPQPGPPWTHTFQPPPQEYGEDGEPIPLPPEPQFTIEPYDLLAPPRVTVEFEGSSDPDSLDYGGLLNLLPVRRGFESPCSLHPAHIIGADGCPRCREIREHQLGRPLHDPGAGGHMEVESGDG